MMLIGNFIVSLLTALVAMVVVMYEPYIYHPLSVNAELAAVAILKIVLAYAFFAFMVSMVREIVKDMEDAKGDADHNCKTLPIVAGFAVAKGLVFALSLAVMAALGYIMYLQATKGSWQPFTYILVAIQLEERDLVAAHGEDYLKYRRRVPMLVPLMKRRSRRATAEAWR